MKYSEEYSKDVEIGHIISQSIQQGEKIDPQKAHLTTIEFVVSKGFKTTVPNVYGVDIQKAKQILEDTGFVVTLKLLPAPTSVEEINGMKINVVLNQSLDAFTEVYKYGESITLEYYDKKPEIPSAPVETPGGDNDGTDACENAPTQAN